MADLNEKAVESAAPKATTTKPKTTSAATKTPKVAKESNEGQNVRFVVVAEGQGGASIGQVLCASLPNNPFMIAVNTSDQDMDQLGLPDNQLFKIGGPTANGAGKSRNKAKTYYKKFTATNINDKSKSYDALTTLIGYYEEVFFHPKDQVIIITCFSSDGGTGSGIGPMLTTGLTNFVNTAKSFVYGGKEYEIDDVTNSVPRPAVVALVPKCAINKKTGALNVQNTRECFLDIQRAIDAGIGHFFIADNNLEGVEYNSTEEMYRIINARIVAPFVKFLGIEMNSSIKCMDLQDKINSLRISGCSSFMSVTKNNVYQYVVPHGQSVARTVAMIRYDPDDPGAEEKKVDDFMKKLDITSVDYMPVFFQVDKSGLVSDSISKDLISSSMIALFGWKSLSAIVEDLTDQLKRIEATNDKKASIVADSARGFDTIADDAAELADRFGTKSMAQSAINDLF